MIEEPEISCQQTPDGYLERLIWEAECSCKQLPASERSKLFARLTAWQAEIDAQPVVVEDYEECPF